MSIRDRRAPPDLLQQARALRAAIPRQTTPGVVELLRLEAERLEAMAEEYRASAASGVGSQPGGAFPR
ncbi:MAG: hypothetical protein EPN98_01025 [Phenylobacterium sp.]|uniref:hypothetical protein n=1 Tax=Phenylobacterium sp. TaxID=1871053 RepID=UPI0011FF0AE5|nr:hypothetical protein [Phenylobacterium sp.]TAL38262.1 MAG: hypothetical protein EPN98_01025 [Phenylobacterium sp.]